MQNFTDRGVAVVHSANPVIRPWVNLTLLTSVSYVL